MIDSLMTIQYFVARITMTTCYENTDSPKRQGFPSSQTYMHYCNASVYAYRCISSLRTPCSKVFQRVRTLTHITCTDFFKEIRKLFISDCRDNVAKGVMCFLDGHYVKTSSHRQPECLTLENNGKRRAEDFYFINL